MEGWEVRVRRVVPSAVHWADLKKGVSRLRGSGDFGGEVVGQVVEVRRLREGLFVVGG